MLMSVWKFKIPEEQAGDNLHEIAVPIGANIVSFGRDPLGNLCVWAVCPVGGGSLKKSSKRLILLVGTGMEDRRIGGARFIGTLSDGGPFVWHAFEVRE